MNKRKGQLGFGSILVGVFALAIAIMAVVAVYWKASKTIEHALTGEDSVAESVSPESTVTDQTAVSDVSETKMQKVIQTPPTLPEKPVKDLIPTEETLRSAVEENPHVTPAPVIEFAMDLYKRRAKALENEPAARSFFTELESCVSDKKASTQTEGLCLLNARYLKTTYSSLDAAYLALEGQATPEAVKYARRMKIKH